MKHLQNMTPEDFEREIAEGKNIDNILADLERAA
jgi:hypothetical protein